MFRGINLLNLDAKGRMAMPTRYRERLEEESDGQLVATIDTESRCLLIYPLHEWEVIERKIDALPSFNPAARRIQRLLIGHANEIELDNNGRFLLAPLLREHAELDKKVILLGQGKKFELWSDAHWNQSRDRWLEEENQHDGELPIEIQSLSL